MNLVVLTSRSDAPQPPTTPITGCSDTDTGWPCVHPNSLTEYFVNSDGDPVCSDPADPSTCVTFEYGAHAYRYDLDHSAATAADQDCLNAMALADSLTDADGTYATSDWAGAITTAAELCEDPILFNPGMINVYLMDNQIDASDSSFNAPCASCVLPMNFQDVDRVLDATLPQSLEYAASEHEMGHGFGLDHSCASPFPTTSHDGATNIMQTGPETCCCESRDINAAIDPTTYSAGGYWETDICVDCSANTYKPAGCTNTPSATNDPDCVGSPFTEGDRAEGFDNGVPADWREPVGQVDRILDTAKADCSAECDNTKTTASSAYAVTGELACHAGSGRFNLVPLSPADRDLDGTGFLPLVPYVVSGDHLGRLSELTSVSIVSLGSASRLVLPTLGHNWRFTPSDPDALSLTNMLRFDSSHLTATPALGVVRTGAMWGTDGVNLSSNTWNWPVVDLVWGCNNDYSANDVRWDSRPASAYRMHLNDIAGGDAQEILVRPDYTAMAVWFELRGYPRASDRVPLGQGSNGTYTWTYNNAGLAMNGWLKPTGSPSGTTLQVHITAMSFGSWSRNNFTLPTLVKLP